MTEGTEEEDFFFFPSTTLQHHGWSKYSLGLLTDMLIDLLLTINTGQDIHELCKEYLFIFIKM